MIILGNAFQTTFRDELEMRSNPRNSDTVIIYTPYLEEVIVERIIVAVNYEENNAGLLVQKN